MDEQTYKQTNRKSPQITRLFPYPGHCLASPHENQEKSERNVKKIWINSGTKNKGK